MEGDEERFVAATKNSVRKKQEIKGQMRLHRECGSTELGKVASGCATQSLWLGDSKVGSQVISKDQSRLPGRGQLGKLREEKEEPATEQRREYKDLGEREEQGACHAYALAMTDKACWEVKM